MRSFQFKARNIGEEKYLTYTMGEETELDEDVLDYIEENSPSELLNIIYEEDDDYDYLTYDISERVSLGSFISGEVKCEQVLKLLRNIAGGLISVKEQAIHLTYILLNKNYVYVDPETCDIKFICLPVETKGSLAAEFKGFVRQLLANMIYDVDEDLSYVGKMLTYINGDSFNLRGLIGLSEALMEENGISFEETAAIETEGVEVVQTDSAVEEPESSVSDFMNADADEPLPEIGDDEEEEEEEEQAEDESEELESILPAGMSPVAEEEPAEEEEEPVEEESGEAVEEESAEEDSYEEETTEDDDFEGEDLDDLKNLTIEPHTEEVEEEETEETEEEDSYEEAEEEEEEEEPAYEPEPVSESKTLKIHTEKESDIDIIKSRIRELVGDVPSAKVDGGGKSVKSLSDLDGVLGTKTTIPRRKPVRVNRAAMIQNQEAVLEEEAEANGETEDLKVPVIEDVYEDMNVEKDKDKEKDDSKPKSNSVLSKTVQAISNVAAAQPPKALPYLIRVSTEERIMLSKTTFKIGKATRGVDYTVSGNGAISRQHAIITQKDGVCYIKDNKSTNHTYVNDQMVEEGSEEILTHDSIIRLGDEEFRFKIR